MEQILLNNLNSTGRIGGEIRWEEEISIKNCGILKILSLEGWPIYIIEWEFKRVL